MINLRTALLEVTSLAGSLYLTAQAVLTAMLQISFLQQKQIAAIRNNPFYQSAIYLNQDSIQKLQLWFNNHGIHFQGSTSGQIGLPKISRTQGNSFYLQECFKEFVGIPRVGPFCINRM